MFDFDYIIGEEAVDFQVNSKLGRSLTEIFADVHKFKASINYDRTANNEEARREFRIAQVCEYVMKTTLPKFVKVVRECCNLEIRSISCLGGESYGICGFFAINIDISDIHDAMYEIISRSSGAHTYVSNKTEDYIDEIASMADNFNAFESKLDSKVFGKSKKPIYVSKVYFDINMAFLADEFVSADVVEPLTPQELAAIMMHEIGHAMSTIEHAADAYFMHSRIKEITVNLKNKDMSEEECLELLKQIDTKLLSKLQVALDGVDGSERPYFTGLIRTVNTISMTIHNLQKADEVGSGSSLLGNLFRIGFHVVLVGIVGTILNLYCSAICLVFGIPVWYELSIRSTKNRNDAGGKLSDVSANHNRDFVMERWADEFVSRHGYGSYLASALNKFDAMVMHSYLNGGDLSSVALRENALWQKYISLLSCITKLTSVLSWFDPTIYEDQYHRLYRLAQNNYALFKNDKVPVQIRNQWFDIVKKTEDEANAAKRFRDSKVGSAAVNVFKALTNPVKWYDYINNGNIDQDLQRLEDNLDDMLNNKLFYLSAKLQARR